MIEIKSSDDDILNSCLQLKSTEPQVALYTNDVNLKNKALCSDLRVVTKSDLLKELNAEDCY